MRLPSLLYADVVKQLPAEWGGDCLPAIQEAVRSVACKVVVLDDDPTGTQTVHDVPVLTDWSESVLREEFESPSACFYVLTNSRSLPAEEAARLAATVGRNLLRASRVSRRNFVVISRSDSTLRGHFPAETDALRRSLERQFDGVLLIPFFEAGGRYTINDIHYVREGDVLIPAGETAFARDPVFGYRQSTMPLWVEEKTRGAVRAQEVQSISIQEVRMGGHEQVTRRLLQLGGGTICVINAASNTDLEVVTLGLLRAEANQKRFLYRTAASFVPLRAGLSSRPLLSDQDVHTPGCTGGLIVVGSYVPRTTVQLDSLLRRPGIMAAEVSTKALTTPGESSAEIRRVATLVDQFLSRGNDVVIYTTREQVHGRNIESTLATSSCISNGLVSIVCRMSIRPRYLLAKGGITSSDIATKALNVRRAVVLGQVVPGVPMWRLGDESRYPGLSYIVFPGNVGQAGDLSAVVDKFDGRRQ